MILLYNDILSIQLLQSYHFIFTVFLGSFSRNCDTKILVLVDILMVGIDDKESTKLVLEKRIMNVITDVLFVVLFLRER